MNEQTNIVGPCVGIAAMVGGVSVGVVALIAIFAPERIAVAGWVVGPLCLMGAFLGGLIARRR